MIRRPPRSTRTDTLFPYTTLFRSGLYHYAARPGHVARDLSGVQPQVAVRLQLGPGRLFRRPRAVELCVDPPHVHDHGRRPAHPLHDDDRADLDPDRLHVHRRHRHALAGPIAAEDTDALRSHEHAELPDRRVHRRLPRPCTRSAEHTSELQSLMRTSYAVFCLNKKKL